MSRRMVEPRAWAFSRPSSSSPPQAKPTSYDTIYFAHATGKTKTEVVGTYLPQRDVWMLRCLANHKEVEARVSSSAYEDALDLLNCWRSKP
jgi:hypothetical protein